MKKRILEILEINNPNKKNLEFLLNYNENVNFEDLLGIFENLGFEVDKTGGKGDHIKINKPNGGFHTILDKNLQLNGIRDERKKILNYLGTTE